jgi:Family of unknown function (DUF5906)
VDGRAMSDEDDIPSRANVPKLSDHPANKAQESSTSFGAPKLDSKQGALDWADQFYSMTWIGNVLRIINRRNPDNVIPITKKDFIDSIENTRIVMTDPEDSTKSKAVPVSKLWLEWHNRRMYERGMIFDPKWKFDYDTMRNGAYNTWPGFAVDPKQGDCHLFIDYIRNIICNGNETHYNYLMCWVSQIFQEPWNKLGTSLVLQGLKGIGKSYLNKILGMLMNGKSGHDRRQKIALTIDSKNSVFGPHNDHLEKAILVCLEEAVWAGDKAHESTLKHYITGHEMLVNPKGLPARLVVNYMRTIIIGNADWLVPAGPDERRFFVLNVSSAQKDNREYFDALDNELLNNGGLEALMYTFMNWQINVNLRTALVTDALIEQKTESMTGVERWWFSLLCSGKLPFVKEDERGYLVIKEKLFADFQRADPYNRSIKDPRSFGMKLYELVPDISTGRMEYHKNGKVISMVDGSQKYTSGNERHNVHIFPKLETCRMVMNYRLKTEYDYGSGSQEWEYPNYTESNIMSNITRF